MIEYIKPKDSAQHRVEKRLQCDFCGHMIARKRYPEFLSGPMLELSKINTKRFTEVCEESYRAETDELNQNICSYATIDIPNRCIHHDLCQSCMSDFNIHFFTSKIARGKFVLKFVLEEHDTACYTEP